MPYQAFGTAKVEKGYEHTLYQTQGCLCSKDRASVATGEGPPCKASGSTGWQSWPLEATWVCLENQQSPT